MSFFQCLGRTKESVQVRGTLKHFVTIEKLLRLGVIGPTPNPQFGGRLLCRSSATVYSKSGGRLLYPEPMDATCHGNRVPY